MTCSFISVLNPGFRELGLTGIETLGYMFCVEIKRWT
jgi:hypothetical protein